ncbi:MAG: serine/threonine-protein kinase, partial [candidate division KSB1 bacterium]
ELPLFAPERARLALPAPSRRPQAEPEPQIGLQTEMLFAEMIAAAPKNFESTSLVAEMPATNETVNEVASSNGPELLNRNAANEPKQAGLAVLHTLSNAGDTTSSSNERALVFSPAPRVPARPVVVTPNELLVQQPLPEVQTPQTVARILSEKTPGFSETQTATRTIELPALEVQRIGRYVIEKELAQGTTGKIYKAWDPKLDRIVVLKTVQYGLSTSPNEIAALKDRIYREARAIAKLSHPNIVIVYDVDDLPEFSYLVMEYLEGRDLKQVLEHEHRLECGRALEIAAQVCNAMEYAHRAGVFHRDLKPSNIMLLEQDDVKVMDFGIAKISNYLSLTQTGRVLGTPSYMAPEQIEGQTTDGRADLFSLGIVLYELLVGKRPFLADSLAALAYKIVHKTQMPPSLENVELPLALDEVLNRALAKKPEERYQNAAELREALVRVQAQLV